MAGLVYKDLINLGQQWKSYLLILVVRGGLSIAQKNPNFFGGMFSVYMAIILLTAYSYDEKSGWDKYALTMPVSRARIVLSKYVLGLLMDIVGFVITLAAFLAAGSSMQEMWLAQSLYQTISLFLIAFQLPVTFKFGVEKARISTVLVVMLPVFAVYMFVQSGIQLPDLDVDKLLFLIHMSPVAGLCLLAVSAVVSIWIYRGKEF